MTIEEYAEAAEARMKAAGFSEDDYAISAPSEHTIMEVEDQSGAWVDVAIWVPAS